MDRPPFLLDIFPTAMPPSRKPKELAFISRNLQAKRFWIGRELIGKILILVRDNPDTYHQMRKFAKPPFESCYIEFDGLDDSLVTGLLWAESRVVVLNRGPKTGWVMPSRLTVLVKEDGFEVRDQRPGEPIEDERDGLMDHLVQTVGMIEVLWLLMHQPGLVKGVEVKGRQKVIKGKLRPARAHTVLTIDLAARDIMKRIMANGSRGSGVREHEVRGTWVHLNHNRRCTHQWERVERPEGKPERWTCPCCDTLRVWRKDHVRGDAKRGNKFHTYEVKDSRLEKAA